jgi:hypothetical protein
MSKIPTTTHEGVTDISGIKIKSYVLDNGTRVLNRTQFIKSLGRTGKAKGGRKYDKEFEIPVFLTAKSIKPFISKNLMENSEPIIFKDIHGQESIGYKAELLPEVCNVFIDAFDAGALSPMQIHIAERCKILIRGFATVGIIALVDEATGYQYDRDRQALHKILEAYISKEFLPWTKRFPDEFYQELFRLKRWNYNPLSVKRPSYVGILTNQLVYKQLPEGVLEELKNKTPKSKSGHRTKRFHQSLTLDIGNSHLEKHLASVITLMRISPNWRKFLQHFNRAFGEQQEFDFVDELDEDKD